VTRKLKNWPTSNTTTRGGQGERSTVVVLQDRVWRTARRQREMERDLNGSQPLEVVLVVPDRVSKKFEKNHWRSIRKIILPFNLTPSHI